MKHRATVVGALGSLERFLAPVYENLPPPIIEEKKMTQYIVWTPNSNLPPKVVHSDRPSAIKAAGAMAHTNPGSTFYVCKLVNSACKPVPVNVNYEDLGR